jgi:hypothetical protein
VETSASVGKENVGVKTMSKKVLWGEGGGDKSARPSPSSKLLSLPSQLTRSKKGRDGEEDAVELTEQDAEDIFKSPASITVVSHFNSWIASSPFYQKKK